MKHATILAAIVVAAGAWPAFGQQADAATNGTPIYRVTVVERTMKAINYQYRAEPTMIDFHGTVLLPKVKGEATVQSKQGRTEIDAKLENLTTPQGFGREYLTYVLWAITPQGRPHNIGEIVPNGSNKASIRVTTDLQAFGLIVTAEPYSAVRQPSDVVVAENQIRPETVGKIETVEVKYGLMPRGQYTWQVSDHLAGEVANAPKVSMGKYEAMLEVYQAQNALAIARSAEAEHYAPNTVAKAQQLLDEAQRLMAAKGDNSRVVDEAREAAQTAEDARVITGQRKQDEKLALANAQLATVQQEKAQAEADARQARAEADSERAARERADAQAAAARQSAAQANAGAVQQPQEHAASVKTELRGQLLEQLNGALPTMDTPRGLVVTIPDRDFDGTSLHGAISDQVARISAAITAHPGLRVDVEGHTDSESTEASSMRHAEAVRDILVQHGLSPAVVSAREMGDSHPVASDSTPSGREENRRVEMVISGDPIGSVPFWDRTYPLKSENTGR